MTKGSKTTKAAKWLKELVVHGYSGVSRRRGGVMKLVVGLVGNATGCGVCRCANGLEVEAAPEGLESNNDEDNDDEQYIKRNLPRTCGHVDTTSAMQTTLPRPCGVIP